ncbi:hypothetical protein QTP88_015104 [Uroleucon formosanum]
MALVQFNTGTFLLASHAAQNTNIYIINTGLGQQYVDIMKTEEERLGHNFGKVQYILTFVCYTFNERWHIDKMDCVFPIPLFTEEVSVMIFFLFNNNFNQNIIEKAPECKLDLK